MGFAHHKAQGKGCMNLNIHKSQGIGWKVLMCKVKLEGKDIIKVKVHAKQ